VYEPTGVLCEQSTFAELRAAVQRVRRLVEPAGENSWFRARLFEDNVLKPKADPHHVF
jgi:hypothetical protein